MNVSKTLIVSHDAGGAEVVSSWVKRYPRSSFYFCIEGPAFEIFKKKIGNIENRIVAHLNNRSIQQADWILTGTSWSSDLEKMAIILAQKQNRKVVSFLDHWANYLERFQYEGQTCLPDEIWVGDEDALRIAQSVFPNDILRLVPNPYFQDIIDELTSCPRPRREAKDINILYVCEPIEDHSLNQHGHALAWGYNEFDAITFFLDKLPSLVSPNNEITVRVRNHPSGARDKYHSILSKYPHMRFEQNFGTSLIEDCLWADWIVGCESMALVVGLLAKKKVYSCIPPGGKPCSLPHVEIEKIC